MDFVDLVKARKSVRRYKPDPVPRDVVKRVLEAAILAPTWANMQGVRYVVVADPAAVAAVKEGIGQKWVASAPSFIVATSHEGASGKNKNGLPYYMLDVGICFQQLVLAATNEGLGTCWIGYFDENVVKTALNVPPKQRVIAITPIGYPDGEAKDTTRKPMQEVAFLDRFDQPLDS